MNLELGPELVSLVLEIRQVGPVGYGGESFLLLLRRAGVGVVEF